ncbi:MAG: porin family protein [Chlamydiales bacterium]|nr:porin family protein [Chlamydiia bacterium]MCP5507901.1 porin family protein [Chlamydiales bacterium]
MKKLLLTIFSAIALTSGSYLSAQLPCETEQGNWYASIMGGVHFKNHINIYDEQIDFDPGYFAGGAVGYRFAKWYNLEHRLELEFAYRANDIGSISINGERIPLHNDVSLNISTYSSMVNLYTIFPINCTIKPYWGFGLGYTHSSLNIRDANGSVTINNNDSFDGLAYQWIVGGNYEMSCNRELSVEYRYLGMHRDLSDHSVGLKLTQHF